MITSTPIRKGKSQRGAVLVVSLIILLIVTLIGVASMRSSNLELKMAVSARDRSVAFEAAESALASIEGDLVSNPPTIYDFLCAGGAQCFSPTCEGGRCFTGNWDLDGERSTCELVGLGETEVSQPWKTEAIWENTARHQVKEVLTSPPVEGEDPEPIEVKYITEFLCFVPRDDAMVADHENNRNDGIPLYRITVRAQGESNRATVMLQSTYRAPDPGNL